MDAFAFIRTFGYIRIIRNFILLHGMNPFVHEVYFYFENYRNWKKSKKLLWFFPFRKTEKTYLRPKGT